MVAGVDDQIDREVKRRLADIERLRGPLRIAVRKTGDGLGIAIPPGRSVFAVGFLSLWLAGWFAGESFALRELTGGPWPVRIFLFIWLIPWTLAGAGVLWVILWQLFGREQLFFTAGALVREWSLLGYRTRRVVMAEAIKSIDVVSGGADLAGLGTIRVHTTSGTMRIGSGLSAEEADLIADLIRTVGQLPATPMDEAADA